MRLKNLHLKEKGNKLYLLLFNTTTLIGSLIGIVTFSGTATLITFLSHSFTWLVVLKSIFVGNYMLMIFLLIRCQQLKKRKPYKYVRKEIVYITDEKIPRHHTSIVKSQIEAFGSRVDIVKDIYCWTGHGKEETPKVLSKGHTLIGGIMKDGGHKYFYIELSPKLNIGERTVIETVQELYDDDNDFQPFLENTITKLTDYLILRVILSPKHRPSSSEILLKTFDDTATSDRLKEKKPGVIDSRTGEIRWEIPKPKMGYRYQIKWSN